MIVEISFKSCFFSLLLTKDFFYSVTKGALSAEIVVCTAGLVRDTALMQFSAMKTGELSARQRRTHFLMIPAAKV